MTTKTKSVVATTVSWLSIPAIPLVYFAAGIVGHTLQPAVSAVFNV